MELDAGTKYRLRIINMSAGSTIDLSLRRGSDELTWDAYAKDGAYLPAALQRSVPAAVRTGAGETYDFHWTPDAPMSAVLQVDWIFATERGHVVLEQPIVVK